MNKGNRLWLAALILLVMIAMITITATWSSKLNNSTQETTTLSNVELVKEYRTYKDSYVGMKEGDAVAKAKRDGFDHRVIEREGESFAITDDFRINRVNFTINDGSVSNVDFY